MSNFYNFKSSEQKISYEPYLYNKANTYSYFLFGIGIALTEIILSFLNLFNIELGLGLFIGTICIIMGLYKLFIKAKTTLVFDKSNDSLIQITPLGRKKTAALSTIYSIITVSENMSYSYELTNKNPSKKTIAITDYITNKSQTKPNIQFLEMEMIPKIESFLNVNKKDRNNL